MPASNLPDSKSRAERPGARGEGVELGEPEKHRLPPARGFLLFTAGLVLLFHRPLLDLLRFSAGSDMFSYIPLVPLMSGYFVWLKRKELPCFLGGSRKGALAAFIVGTAILAGHWTLRGYGWNQDANDQLSLLIAAFLFFFVSGCCFFLGHKVVRAVAFPLALLSLMVPLPTFLTECLNRFLQHASAEVSYALLKVVGEPVLREGLRFQLPGIPSIEVAEECSGIRSTLVLFITSLLAGYLFLTNPRYRSVLALMALPLGILRNGLRIFLIAMLCAHVDPKMIDSPLHHRGGPVFFVLSLLLLFLLLVVLRKLEKAKDGKRKVGVQEAEQIST